MQLFGKRHSILLSALAGASLFFSAQAMATSAVLATQSYDNDQEQLEFSQGQLAQILAPIALYPDTLLTHVLIASTFPIELVQAHRYVQDNPNTDTQVLMQYGESQNWDPSVVALMGFADLLQQLNDDLSWTTTLGEAFLNSEESVLASIQELRRDAQYANTLNNLENMRVSYEEEQIVLEPKQAEHIYVPIYDPHYAFGAWKWAHHKPVFWGFPRHLRLRPSFGIYWSPRVRIGFDFFFGGFHWKNRHVLVSHHKGSRSFRNYKAFAKQKSVTRYKHHARYNKAKHVRYNKGFVNKKHVNNKQSKKKYANTRYAMLKKANGNRYKNAKGEIRKRDVIVRDVTAKNGKQVKSQKQKAYNKQKVSNNNKQTRVAMLNKNVKQKGLKKTNKQFKQNKATKNAKTRVASQKRNTKNANRSFKSKVASGKKTSNKQR